MVQKTAPVLADGLTDRKGKKPFVTVQGRRGAAPPHLPFQRRQGLAAA